MDGELRFVHRLAAGWAFHHLHLHRLGTQSASHQLSWRSPWLWLPPLSTGGPSRVDVNSWQVEMIPRHVSYQRLGARQRHLAHVAGPPGVHLGHRDGGVVPQQTGVDRLDSSLLWSRPSARLSYRLTSS